MNRFVSVVLTATFCLLAAAGSAFAQEGIEAGLEARMAAVEVLIGGSGEASYETFIRTQVDPQLLQTMPRAELLDLLARIRKTCARAGDLSAMMAGADGLRLVFGTTDGNHILEFHLSGEDPFLITSLSLSEGKASSAAEAFALAWDHLPAQLAEAAVEGFSGAVLVVRGEKTILEKGYGFANRETGVPNTNRTVFDIGSTPIDFTRAAVLLLEQNGELKTSDRVSEYLDNVPADKRTISLDHLMSGRSGLPNFHHIAGVDADYDLSWIDRDEAVRRILGKDLLFAPGDGEAHSHSAWVLLAAVVEIVSGQSYDDFLREKFFEPLGMKDTGPYQLAREVESDRVAVGYGSSSVGPINTPAYWGDTSWLVTGSGGMVSNPRDLYRWNSGLHGGRVLAPEFVARYFTGSVLAGGNDRGFFCLYNEGPGTRFFMCSNAQRERGDIADRVGSGLVKLVLSDQ